MKLRIPKPTIAHMKLSSANGRSWASPSANETVGSDTLAYPLLDADGHHIAGEVESNDGRDLGPAGEVKSEVAGASCDVQRHAG